MNRFDQLTVILVEPQNPGNIGMVCRAMANFGVQDLRLVDPCPHLHPEAHKFAVFASDLLGSARVFSRLEDALADLHQSVAVTRRQGRLRGEPLPAAKTPPLLRLLPPGGQLGLVFGREDAGLTRAEVALCTRTAHIPSHPVNGSLNLAQAVLVFLYEFFQDAEPGLPARPAEDMPTQAETEALFVRMEEALTRIAFLNPASPEARLYPLRRIMQRSGLSRQEVGLLLGMWDQIAWSVRDWRGRKRGE